MFYIYFYSRFSSKFNHQKNIYVSNAKIVNLNKVSKLLVTTFGSSRKACLLTTTLVILFPFFFPPKNKREEEKENELTRFVIKSHAFLLDPAFDSKQIYNKPI